MIGSYTSTFAISSGLRSQVMRLQSDLSKAQQEVTTGTVVDLGLDQGLATGRTLTFSYQQTTLQTIIDSNKLTAGRLDAGTQALSQLSDIAQKFSTSLTNAKATSTDPQVLVQSAKASLQAMIGALSTTYGGDYLFSGIASDKAPVANYFGTPPSAGKSAVDAAFQATFGFSQSDPQVANISQSQMDSFLSTTYSGLFDDTGWPANFYQGSSTALTARIDPNETTTASVTANDPAIRTLMSALTMVSDLGVDKMNTSTINAVLDQAQALANRAVSGLTELQTSVGTMSSKTNDATAALTAQKNILTTTFSQVTSVDPYSAATRVSQLTTQLQTAYSLTSQLQQLSLLKYL